MKNTLLVLFLISILSCSKDEVEPRQLYGDWYFLGVFNHRGYTVIDYNNIDLSKLSLIQITNDAMKSKNRQFEYSSNIVLSTEYSHPQKLALGGKISQKNILFNYFGNSQIDSLFTNGLKKSDSYYFQKATSKLYQLTLNFENSDDNYLLFLKAR